MTLKLNSTILAYHMFKTILSIKHSVTLFLKPYKSFLAILIIWYGWNHLFKLFILVLQTLS